MPSYTYELSQSYTVYEAARVTFEAATEADAQEQLAEYLDYEDIDWRWMDSDYYSPIDTELVRVEPKVLTIRVSSL